MRDRGKCPKCAAPRGIHWACVACRERADRRLKAKRALRIAAGTCALCDDERVPGYQLCPHHRARQIAARQKYQASTRRSA